MDTIESDTLPGFDESLFNDMFLPHEGFPAGVPDNYSWKHKPASTYGINIPPGWNGVTAWGQVYADQNLPNPDKKFPKARVHIKDLQLSILHNNGDWELIQDVQDPTGFLYVEDYVNDEHKPAKIQTESGGGISIQAGSGFCFHFFPEDISEIDTDDIKGVFVVCKARLIGIEKNSELPKYLLNVGGDYWRNTSAEWESDYSNNGDIAIGRFKYVTPEWRYFTMHTFSQAEVEQIVFPIGN